MGYESLQGGGPKQEKVSTRIQELSAVAEADVVRLKAEATAEEKANTLAPETRVGQMPRGPREITGRELGVKVELAAANRAAGLLNLAQEGAQKEQPLGRAAVYEDVLLDISSSTPLSPIQGVNIGIEGTTGLKGYFEEGMKIHERTLQYQDNPAVAMRTIPYFYKDQRGRGPGRELSIAKQLGALTEGNPILLETTDVDNVHIKYARVKVPTANRYSYEERLRMSILVDYLKK